MDSDALSTAFKRVRIREIDVDGIKIQMRGFTGKERLDFVRRVKAFKDGDQTQFMSDADICALAICHPDGKRRFESGAEIEDWDSQALETIAHKILELSGLKDDSQERAAGESPASPS